MVAQQRRKNKNEPLRSDEDKRAKNKKTRPMPQPGGTSNIPDENKPGEGNAVAKNQNALDPPQIDGELARDASKKSRKTPPKAREKSPVLPATGEERKAPIRRDSFVVRLSIDENNQLGRTEIEHIASGRKQSFLELNSDSLVAFMKACIAPVMNTSRAAPVALVSRKVEEAAPDQLTDQPIFVVSGIQLLSSGNADTMGLTLVAEKPFTLQAHFKFKESEAGSLATDELFFEIKVHATEITSGRSQLLVTHNVKLTDDLEEYIVPIEVPGLPHGLYRLFTVAKLEGHRKAASWYEGPVIQVI